MVAPALHDASHAPAAGVVRSDRGRQRELLALTFAWGCTAECVTNVCTPLVSYGVIDVSAAALNVVGALLAGAALTLEQASNDTRVQLVCAAFQTGFVGVCTSFTYMVEQAAALAVLPWYGHTRAAAFVALLLGLQVVAFSWSASLFARPAAALCTAQRERSRRLLPSLQPHHVLRVLITSVLLVSLWVMVSPPGAVADPREMRTQPQSRAPLQLTKADDVYNLTLGLVLQACGLLVCSLLTRRSASAAGVHWESLATNALAVLLLLGCSALPCKSARTLLADGDVDSVEVLEAAAASSEGNTNQVSSMFSLGCSVLVAKFRTTACGAMSISAGLAAIAHSRWQARGRGAQLVGLNLALHGYLAIAGGHALVWLTPSVAQPEPLGR
mmetsp:Transcript_23612/g.50871  ORF Transcript_23612/g.50871 Transcript_23612/m.50871 type:complete len:386 (-) Transcript_23612:338-1495(-)